MAKVMLFKLVVSSVAEGWQVWISLVIGGVLFKVELVVVSLMVSVRLFRLGRRLVAEWCWLCVSLMVEGMGFVGEGWHVCDSLVDDVLFMLEWMASLMVGVELFVVGLRAGAVGWLSLLVLVGVCGVLFTSVGIVGVV